MDRSERACGGSSKVAANLADLSDLASEDRGTRSWVAAASESPADRVAIMVRRSAIALACATAAFAAVGSSGAEAQNAAPAGYVEGVEDPEDLVQLPGTDWVIASGRRVAGSNGPGHLYLVNATTRRVEVVFPSAVPVLADVERQTGCPGLPDPVRFEAHGLGLRAGIDGKALLYVVNHAARDGGREAIEVFEVDASRGKPSIRWMKCILAPPKAWFNDVVALPEGGFAATSFMDPTDRAVGPRLAAAADTGAVFEWHPGTGYRIVPNSAMSGPNGIEIDPEGRYYFVNAWGSQQLVRIARDDHRRAAAPTGMLADNSAWTWNGRLIVVGQAISAKQIDRCLADAACHVPFKALEFDPATLESRVLLDVKDVTWAATSPRPVGDELWLGAQRTKRIIRYPLPPTGE